MKEKIWIKGSKPKSSINNEQIAADGSKKYTSTYVELRESLIED